MSISMNRRQLLRHASAGFGSLALAVLLNDEASAATTAGESADVAGSKLSPKKPHFAARLDHAYRDFAPICDQHLFEWSRAGHTHGTQLFRPQGGGAWPIACAVSAPMP